jgi:hypothetical protein
MKICVVGAGWYGCHITKMLCHLNLDVTLFESESQIFSGASGLNQNRLHLGFHYARNHRTRIQSLTGFSDFKKTYGSLLFPIENNIYAVPQNDSLLDFQTYKGIMSSSGISFNECSNPSFLEGIEGSIETKEGGISVKLAREFFHEEIGPNLRLNTRVVDIEQRANSVIVNGQVFDFLVDCTWGHLLPLKYVFYEVSLLLVMKRRRHDWDLSVTLVDGDLWSIYGTEIPDLYTVSSVKYTPLHVSACPLQARDFLANVSLKDLEKAKENIVSEVEKHFPSFSDYFNFENYQLSIKTKPIALNSDRSCYVENEGRIITVLSGKIDNIFYASDLVTRMIAGEL